MERVPEEWGEGEGYREIERDGQSIREKEGERKSGDLEGERKRDRGGTAENFENRITKMNSKNIEYHQKDPASLPHNPQSHY